MTRRMTQQFQLILPAHFSFRANGALQPNF